MIAMFKASLAKTASHFGLVENDKLSFKGLGSFSYQAIAVVLMVSLMLFLPEARMEAGFAPVVLLSLLATVGIIAGVKVFTFFFDGVCKRINASFKNKMVGSVVSALALFASAALIFVWPGAFFFGLSKLLPGVIAFPGWSNAIFAGIMVLSADSILGGLTGVSLMSGKRKPADAPPPPPTPPPAA